MASTSNQKSSSSASQRKATKRKATPRAKATKTPKAPKAQKANKAPKAPKLKAQKALKKSSGTSRAAINRATTRGSAQDRSRLASADVSARSARATKPAVSGAQRAGRIAFIVAVVVAVLAGIALIALLVLSRVPVFVIEGIDAQASDHVTAETIAKLANVEEGTTLLSLDSGQIKENIKRNPWIKDVTLAREFPDTLGISVEERPVGAIVVIGAGASVWALGSDGIWIEPIKLDTSVDVASAALAKATELGCLLISDVPASVDPAQGSPTTDDTILAVLDYQDQLSDEISSQARVYYASSVGSISMVMDSGLEVSLGSPEDINSKSLALSEIMATYPGQLTYINVRVATKPTYRKVPDGTSLSTVQDVVLANVAATAADTGSAEDNSQEGEDGSDTSSDEDSSEE